jgi:hypothetical protein
VFDARGNEIAEAYFGLSGEPVLSSNSAHLIIDEFDARGNVSARSYYGASGQAILYDGLHHRHEHVFDTKGNRLSEAYFGVAGEPVSDSYGVHRYVSEVDAAGNRTSLATFGPQGKPVLNNNGIHRAEQAFDALGNLTAQAVFGIAGEPVTGANGVHRTTYERDDEGNLLTTRFEGIEGIPLFGGEPPAVRAVVQEHDARGNVVVEAYFDAAGAPVADRNGHERIEITYGPSGRREADHYFTDADDALPERQITYLFDASAQAVGSRLAHFASHPEFGRYRIELEHDSEGNLLSRRVLDSNGRDLLAGTVVDEILPDGECARQDLDIRPGDIIVSYSGVAYPGMQAFVDLKSAEPPDGQWRPLTLERDGTELVVEVPPGLLGIGIRETPLGYADEALSAAQNQ